MKKHPLSGCFFCSTATLRCAGLYAAETAVLLRWSQTPHSEESLCYENIKPEGSARSEVEIPAVPKPFTDLTAFRHPLTIEIRVPCVELAAVHKRPAIAERYPKISGRKGE
jgi:hypothetical protein